MKESTRSTDEYNAVIETKLEEFQLVLIDQMKSNLQKIIKNKVREIVKEELKGMKTLSPTVTFLQERLSEEQKSNLSVQ